MGSSPQILEHDGLTKVQDVAEATQLWAEFPLNAMTGQSFIVSNGWFMQ